MVQGRETYLTLLHFVGVLCWGGLALDGPSEAVVPEEGEAPAPRVVRPRGPHRKTGQAVLGTPPPSHRLQVARQVGNCGLTRFCRNTKILSVINSSTIVLFLYLQDAQVAKLVCISAEFVWWPTPPSLDM